MTISGMGSSIGGINTAILRQDITSNNIANLNTSAFKSSRAHQSEVVANGQGVGVSVDATTRKFSLGGFQFTSRPLDISIAGAGFFKLNNNDNGFVYTRSGNFYIDANGDIVNQDGLRLEPNINIPAGAKNVTINNNGEVTALLPGETKPTLLGQIKPVSFSNPAGLQALGNNLYAETANSGAPRLTTGDIKIQQSFLELSNVDLAEEFTQSIINSRTMEANVKAFRVQDRMTGTVLDLIR